MKLFHNHVRCTLPDVNGKPSKSKKREFFECMYFIRPENKLSAMKVVAPDNDDSSYGLA